MRLVLLPLFAWLLIAHSVLFPLARVRALELVRALEDEGWVRFLAGQALPGPPPSSQAFALVSFAAPCLSGASGADSDAPAMPLRHAHDDMGCCAPGRAPGLEVPQAISAAPPALIPLRSAPVRILFQLPQGRAPPAITATPAQSRAPPFPVLPG